MKRSVANSTLTKDYIESKVSQELIMSKYLDIPVSTIIKCVNKNTLIKSVFRDDDKTGSMGFTFNKKGKLKVRDFGGFGFFGDVYDVVAHILSLAYERKIEPNNKKDFYFILKHIAETFSDIIDGKEKDKNIDETIQSAIRKGQKTKAIIEVVPRSWNKQDKEIWEHWDINLSYLSTHFVIPVDQYYVNRGIDSDPKYHHNSKDPCYAYILGQNRAGIYLIKLYFPLRNREREQKFITNCNVIEGLLNLELDDYDYILITKSSKDRLSIGSHLTSHPFYGGLNAKLKIGIVNLPSESYKLTEREYAYLVNRLKTNGLIISLLDFDRTGRIGAKYLEETYQIPYMFITRGEFGLYNYKSKDFAELHDIYSNKEIDNFITETIHYVELKYNKNERDSDAYMEGLPYT